MQSQSQLEKDRIKHDAANIERWWREFNQAKEEFPENYAAALKTLKFELQLKAAMSPPKNLEEKNRAEWAAIIMKCFGILQQQNRLEELHHCLHTIQVYQDLDRSYWLQAIQMLSDLDLKLELALQPPYDLSSEQQTDLGKVIVSCLKELLASGRTEKIERCLIDLKTLQDFDRSPWIEGIQLLVDLELKFKVAKHPPSNLTHTQ